MAMCHSRPALTSSRRQGGSCLRRLGRPPLGTPQLPPQAWWKLAATKFNWRRSMITTRPGRGPQRSPSASCGAPRRLPSPPSYASTPIALSRLARWLLCRQLPRAQHAPALHSDAAGRSSHRPPSPCTSPRHPRRLKASNLADEPLDPASPNLVHTKVLTLTLTFTLTLTRRRHSSMDGPASTPS